MVYKNSAIKHVLIMLFSAGYCLLIGIIRKEFAYMWILFVLAGLGCATEIYISVSAEKKSKPLRAEISKTRNIVCEGPASYTKADGWMFLSEVAIEFYEEKADASKEVAILLNSIIAVDGKRKRLLIKTQETDYRFFVYKAKKWKKTIEATL